MNRFGSLRFLPAFVSEYVIAIFRLLQLPTSLFFCQLKYVPQGDNYLVVHSIIARYLPAVDKILTSSALPQVESGHVCLDRNFATSVGGQ